MQEIENVDPMLDQILKSVSNLTDMIPKLKKISSPVADTPLVQVRGFLSPETFTNSSFSMI